LIEVSTSFDGAFVHLCLLTCTFTSKKYQNPIPEPGTIISGFADNKKKKKKYKTLLLVKQQNCYPNSV
jgi:hypothetical protein